MLSTRPPAYTQRPLNGLVMQVRIGVRRQLPTASGDGVSHGCESQTKERFCLVNPALLEAHDRNGVVDEFLERASK